MPKLANLAHALEAHNRHNRCIYCYRPVVLSESSACMILAGPVCETCEIVTETTSSLHPVMHRLAESLTGLMNTHMSEW